MQLKKQNKTHTHTHNTDFSIQTRFDSNTDLKLERVKQQPEITHITDR